ncbi:hypothetical protein K438DRAFT_1097278 [Mycena galopus ATCC 62051]|nr:hypothetical protein K438DRAFT_1097278 [Mycena galopus ATCC 62051]
MSTQQTRWSTSLKGKDIEYPAHRLVTSLPTISKNRGEHFAVGRLVQLGARQRADPEFEF